MHLVNKNVVNLKFIIGSKNACELFKFGLHLNSYRSSNLNNNIRKHKSIVRINLINHTTNFFNNCSYNFKSELGIKTTYQLKHKKLY